MDRRHTRICRTICAVCIQASVLGTGIDPGQHPFWQLVRHIRCDRLRLPLHRRRVGLCLLHGPPMRSLSRAILPESTSNHSIHLAWPQQQSRGYVQLSSPSPAFPAASIQRSQHRLWRFGYPGQAILYHSRIGILPIQLCHNAAGRSAWLVGEHSRGGWGKYQCYLDLGSLLQAGCSFDTLGGALAFQRAVEVVSRRRQRCK